MKFILAVLLCGVAYTTASPTCSDDGIKKCFPTDIRIADMAFKETEEYLNVVCESADCFVDYKNKCGPSESSTMYMGLIYQSEKLQDTICVMNSPLRRKYVENAKCMYKVTENLREKCNVKEGLDKYDPEYCQEIEHFVDCSNKLMLRECGRDAYDVLSQVVDKKFYGCIE